MSRKTVLLATLSVIVGILLAPVLIRAGWADPALGPSLKVTDGTTTVANAHTTKYTSGCTVTANGTEADIACAGAGGTVTAVTASNGITSTGGITPNISTVSNTHIAYVDAYTGNDGTATGSSLAPYATVQSAITNQCITGDANATCSIHVVAGTYTESPVVPVTFKGIVTIEGDGGFGTLHGTYISGSLTYSPNNTNQGNLILRNIFISGTITASGVAGTTALKSVELTNVGCGTTVITSAVEAIVTGGYYANVLTFNEVPIITMTGVYAPGDLNNRYSAVGVFPNGATSQSATVFANNTIGSATVLSGRVNFGGAYNSMSGVLDATGLTGGAAVQPTVQCFFCTMTSGVNVTYPDAANGFATNAVVFDGSEIWAGSTINVGGTTRIAPLIRNAYFRDGTITLGDYVDLNLTGTTSAAAVSVTATVNKGTVTYTGIQSANVGASIAAAATVAPTSLVTHITGHAAAIVTITAPAACTVSATGCSLTLIFDDAAASWTAAGNIIAAGNAPAAGASVTFTYDQAAAKWYPTSGIPLAVAAGGTGGTTAPLLLSGGTMTGAITTANIAGTIASSASSMQLASGVANSGSNIAYILNSTNTLSGSTSLLQLTNNGVEKFRFDNGGDILIPNTAGVLNPAGTQGILIESDGAAVFGTAFYPNTDNGATLGKATNRWSTVNAATYQAGKAGTTTGSVLLSGSSSGTITIKSQAAAGTYEFDMPTTAGTAGQALISQGGGGTAMTWGGSEWTLGGYSAAKSGGTGQHQQGFMTNAGTLTAGGSTITVDVGTGTGAGNYVIKLCSDGVTCGAGNIYLTCTIGCTTAAGTVTSCTVTKSAVSAGTTLTWTETTACTNDPGVNFTAHATIP